MKSPRFLEYIETDGQQYIDTGIHIYGWGDGIVMRACITTPSTNYDTFFGCRKGNGGRFTARYGNSTNGELQMQFSNRDNFSNGYAYWNTGIRKNTNTGWISFQFDPDIVTDTKTYSYGHFGYSENGQYKSGSWEGVAGTGAEYPTSLFLCALHDEDQGAIDFAYMRLSSCVIYGTSIAHKEGDPDNQYTSFQVPVRVFFPALDESGQACLYDAISDEYFYSPNGKAFIAGPQITNRMLFRVFSRDYGYTPEYRIRAIQTLSVPQSNYYASAVKGNPNENVYEFVGYDTDPEAFTAVYATYDYRETGAVLPANLAGQIIDVYAVFKSITGYLVKDGHGVFYTLNRDGTRRNLGQQELCANLFRDYAFQGYPGANMLTDLFSPSIYNWTKKYWEDEDFVKHYYAPAVFDATVKAVPPLPQLIVYPIITLRKPLAYVTIPGDDATLWNVSFDGGTTWYKYESGWIAVTEDGDGSIKRKFEILDNDDWTPMLTNGTIRFRAWVRRYGWVSSIRNEYTEGETND